MVPVPGSTALPISSWTRRVARSLVIVFVALLMVAGAAPSPAGATPSDAERELAEKYAPILMLKAQEYECDPRGEAYAPMNVDLLLDSREVVLRQAGRGDPVVHLAPTASDLFGLGEGFYLDFAGDALAPGCVFEQTHRRLTEGQPAVMYAHVVVTEREPQRLFLQYWSFWIYNDWVNIHEGDWEMIGIVFDASSAEEALQTDPVAIGYNQHEGGERAAWGDAKLETSDGRPVVYSSAGSHASYFGSAIYLGRGPSEGFGCDDTSGPSVRVDPEVVVLPSQVDDPSDPLAWLAFEGRWGERHPGPFNGPTGPNAKPQWLDPEPWFDSLRDSSVVIPASDTRANSVISTFCGVVETGATALVWYTQSPTTILVALGLIVLAVSFVLRRTDWSRVSPEPLVARRRGGQIVRAAWRIVMDRPLPYLLFGLIGVPAAVATALLAAVLTSLPFFGQFAELVGRRNGANLVLAILAGGLANAAAFTAVSALVAHHLTRVSESAEVASTVAATWARRADLVGAFVKGFLIVAVLLPTVIGIPWAIRQVVRYQFTAQAVMIDGGGGSSALRRSGRLVRGRWWHTATVAIGLNLLIGGAVVFAGLLLLLGTRTLPLWAFSAFFTLAYMLTAPLIAVAMTLLYGDARAEHDGVGEQELATASA